MSKWVESETYAGVCRREHEGLRIIERRRIDQSTPAPALATLLRQLRVRWANLNSPRSEQAFLHRLTAVATIARERGEVRCGELLEQLRAELEAGLADDLEATVLPALNQAAEVLSDANGGTPEIDLRGAPETRTSAGHG